MPATSVELVVGAVSPLEPARLVKVRNVLGSTASAPAEATATDNCDSLLVVAEFIGP